MDRDDIIKMAKEAGIEFYPSPTNDVRFCLFKNLERFAALVAAHERKAFIETIEPYLIPVGNSRSGELACKWNVRTAKEKNT